MSRCLWWQIQPEPHLAEGHGAVNAASTKCSLRISKRQLLRRQQRQVAQHWTNWKPSTSCDEMHVYCALDEQNVVLGSTKRQPILAVFWLTMPLLYVLRATLCPGTCPALA